MTQSAAVVSIIMNCYNGEKYLKEAIDSIYAQNYPNWEIIFWDNVSTDNSAVIAKSYDEKLKYFMAKEHADLGKARNLALNEAKGDYVSFLDCDDVYLVDKIKFQLVAMQENNAVLSYGGWIKIDEEGKELKKYKFKMDHDVNFESLLAKYVVNFQTLMIDNNFLRINNLFFNETLKFSADFDLVLRIAYRNPVMSINKILSKNRVHDDSLSKNQKTNKFNDYNDTIQFFRNLGAQKKYKNFEYLALKARHHGYLIDSFDNREYKYFLLIFIQYATLVFKELFVRIKSFYLYF